MRRISSLLGVVLAALFLVAGCSSPRLHLESISKDHGLLSFENGAMITDVPQDTRAEMMKNYCSPRSYEITDQETKTVGQYRFRTKVLFKCTEGRGGSPRLEELFK